MGEALTITVDHKLQKRRGDLSEKLSALSNEIQQHTIEDEADYERAAEFLDELNTFLDLVEEVADRPRAEAYDLYQHFLDKKKQALGPGEEARDALKAKMERFRERREKRLEDKREQLQELASSDDPADVEHAIEQMSQLDESPTPDIDGVHYRTNWSGELEDGDEALRRLCHAISQGQAPVSLVQLNSKKANELARRRKRELDAIPGMRSVKSQTLVDQR